MKIQIVIKNKFGEFKSKSFDIPKEDYAQIMELSKTFYKTGYEMETDYGFVVIPPDVIRDSILFIEIL